MLDLRLPYFYHLPLAVLLTLYSLDKLSYIVSTDESGIRLMADGVLQPTPWSALRLLICTTPAIVAAGYFFREFYQRHDLYLRETIFILSAVQFLTYFLPAFLPR